VVYDCGKKTHLALAGSLQLVQRQLSILRPDGDPARLQAVRNHRETTYWRKHLLDRLQAQVSVFDTVEHYVHYLDMAKKKELYSHYYSGTVIAIESQQIQLRIMH
jgi:hypothetical protein